MNPSKEYIIKSDSNPNKTYTVKYDGFRWFCSCPSFRFNCHQANELKAHDTTGRKKRFCKHILQVKGEI